MRMSMWKENGNISHYGKREQNVQNTDAIKITDTPKYYVRLEPGTFGMWSENHTSTPKSRMKSKDVQ